LSTATNLIKLFLLINLGLFYFLGLGWVIIGPLLHGSLIKKTKDFSLLQEVPLALLCGMIINLGIFLCVQGLIASLLMGGFIAVLGFVCFGFYFFRYHYKQVLAPIFMNKWIGAIILCLIYLGAVFADPLIEWDARSIFFLHSKMIFTAGSIGPSAGWLHPSVVFSHVEYPNLIPAIAAQVSYVVGFWNEFFPKISLFYLLVPAIIWLFTFARKSFSFIALLLFIPLSLHMWLVNGLQDGNIALFFSIALLLLGRFSDTHQKIDLVSGLCCLLTTILIKNEGNLVILSAIIPLIAFNWISLTKISQDKSFSLVVNINVPFFEKPFSIKNLIKNHWKHILISLILISPYIIWNIYKTTLNLPNDLEIGTIQSVQRIVNRLNDGSYMLIIQNVYDQIKGSLLLLGLLFFASVAWHRGIYLPKDSLLAIFATTIYCMGIITIYLLTPADLNWHLTTSINRTMLPVSAGFLVSTYFILNSIETGKKISR